MTTTINAGAKVFWFLPTHGDSRYLGTSYGGRAVAIDFEHDRSTTKLVAKIRG